MRTARLLASLALLALVACTSEPAASPPVVPLLGPGAPEGPRPAEPGPIVLQPAPADAGLPGEWESARSDGDRAVLLSFTGAAPGRGDCESDYVGTVSVEADRVVVGVDPVPDPATRPSRDCTAEGHSRLVRVELPEPLAGRTLFDRRTRKPGPLVDGAALLALPAPPEGYAFEREGGAAHLGAGWQFHYTAGERAPFLVVTHEHDDGEPLDDGLVVMEEVEVRGAPALVLAQFPDAPPVRVSWRERGAVVSVGIGRTNNNGPNERLLTKEQLLEVARSLR